MPRNDLSVENHQLGNGLTVEDHHHKVMVSQLKTTNCTMVSPITPLGNGLDLTVKDQLPLGNGLTVEDH
jgi:hypothetical protein